MMMMMMMLHSHLFNIVQHFFDGTFPNITKKIMLVLVIFAMFVVVIPPSLADLCNRFLVTEVDFGSKDSSDALL